MGSRIKILSIDGGGIRGIIPAIFLAKLEEKLELPLSQVFDLIAGTSTGGIITLGLTTPDENNSPKYNSKDLVSFYEKFGEEIFSASFGHKIKSLGNLLQKKYDSSKLELLLKSYFGDTLLSESLCPIIITAYDIERRMAFFFKTRHARDKNQPNLDFLYRDIARATSAAPTYFETYKLPSNDKLIDYYPFIDGGVFANTPAMCGYVEAIKTYKDMDDCILVSIGTGKLGNPIEYQKAKNWGVVNWAVPIIDVVMNGVNDTTHYQLTNLLPAVDGIKRYYRFQIRLGEKNTKMDDASSENIRQLKLAGEAMISENENDIDNLVRLLSKNSP